MNKKEKSDNRRALPKFLGIMLACMVIGALLGESVGYLGGLTSPEEVKEAVSGILVRISPWAQWLLAVGFTAAEILLYRKAKRQFASWDGEDEMVMEQAEWKLSWVLMLTSVHLVLAFTLEGFLQLLGAESLADAVMGLLGFVAAMASCLVMQQKTVDLTRKMNPEKKGSVYDMKFHKKWMDSCDENERRQIGQAAYKAFSVVNGSCVILWLLSVVLGDLLELGPVPMALIMLIFGINQVSFQAEAMKLAGHRESDTEKSA